MFIAHSRHSFFGTILAAGVLVLLFVLFQAEGVQAQQASPPNVVLIFADDMGYNDPSNFGVDQGTSSPIQTPNLERIAVNGVKHTSFYVPVSVCTPSRAALMTGRYAPRTGSPKVIFPGQTGMDADEKTLAEGLKAAGYATAAVGKWHLGDDQDGDPSDLPTRQGFDSYYGIPYSNDMSPTVLMRDETVIENPVNQETLTQRYTQEALAFIDEQATQNQPFFLYMPHTFPHVPLFRSDEFKGVSDGGTYGDVIE